jgi:hypothetical protein
MSKSRRDYDQDGLKINAVCQRNSCAFIRKLVASLFCVANSLSNSPSGLKAAAFAALRFSFVRSSASRNRRTQAAPNSSLSLRGKLCRSAFSPCCSGYDARSCSARSAHLDLRDRANAPRQIFPLRDKGTRPRDPVGDVFKSVLPAFPASRPH